MIPRRLRRKEGDAGLPGRPPSGEQPDRVYNPGDVIGGEWRVLRAMEGGFGLVYAVEHRESGGRRVLKAPKQQSDPAVRESFRTEAETWVRLGDHPNIVCAHGVDTLNPRFYASTLSGRRPGVRGWFSHGRHPETCSIR